MFNSLTESLKTISELRDVKTNARRQSQEATTLMSERSPQQSRETTLKATRLFWRKRAKSSLDEQFSHGENSLNERSLRNQRFPTITITPRDIARASEEIGH
jgi:septal ring factor EnvC (AmiA/AmiB activator)